MIVINDRGTIMRGMNNMTNKVTIIGAGSFASAIAQIFSDKNYDVLMYTTFHDQEIEINENKTNKYYYDDLLFSERVNATTSLKKALEFSKYIVLAVPSCVIREISKEINKVVDRPKVYISVAKGLEPITNKMLSEIIDEEVEPSNKKGVVVLSGPSHAEEILQRNFTALVAVSTNEQLSKEVQKLFSNDYIRVYTTIDLIGVQVGASVKNILAVASGIINGMGYGDNTRAALITRGLAEMVRYGVSKGAKRETFFGLTGIGDLIVTATSLHSRNFQVGKKVGGGMNVEQAILESKTVVEGIRAVEVVHRDAVTNNVDMPITEGVYKIFFEGYNPKQVMDEIMKRELKPEELGI